MTLTVDSLNSLVSGWITTRDSLQLKGGDISEYDEGRLHAYISSLENYEEFDDFDNGEEFFTKDAPEDEVDIEDQLNRIILSAEAYVGTGTEYSNGYRVGLKECAEDAKNFKERFFA